MGRNNTWLLARPVKSQTDLQLWPVVAVLPGVNGCQVQLSSTQLTALAAARTLTGMFTAKAPRIARITAAGCQQHPGSMLQIVNPVSCQQAGLRLQLVTNVLHGASGCPFQLSSTQLAAQAATTMQHWFNRKHSQKMSHTLLGENFVAAHHSASGSQQLRNNTWLLARPVKSQTDLQLWPVIAVLPGVNGCQFQLSSTQLTALAAARTLTGMFTAKAPRIARITAAGCQQHPGSMLQIVDPVSCQQAGLRWQLVTNVLHGASGCPFLLSNTQLAAQAATTMQHWFNWKHSQKMSHPLLARVKARRISVAQRPSFRNYVLVR